MVHIITYDITNSILSEIKLLEEDSVLLEIETVIKDFKLNITQKTTLSTMKGSIHYHLKLGKLPGLLELTYWPVKKRLWVEIHNNRTAEWNLELIQPFSEALARHFSGQVVCKLDA